MVSKHQFLHLYENAFVPVYTDLVGLVSDKPMRCLTGIEIINSHLIYYIKAPGSKSGKENLNKAYDHLIILTIVCAKLLWIELDAVLSRYHQDEALRAFSLNISETDFTKKFNEFQEMARTARRNELQNINTKPMACFEDYKKSIDLGWALFRSIDLEKEKSLRKFKFRSFVKQQWSGLLFGIITGITSTLILDLGIKKVLPLLGLMLFN